MTIRTEESGTKTVMDFVTRNSEGTIGLVECKGSSTARLSRNQRIAHPEIERSGGTIVGEGKPGFPGGTFIPPGTPVEVARP